eukprot:PRCOL_00001852-RA
MPMRARRVAARAESTPKFDIDVSEISATLADKWDKTEDKSTVALYAGGAVIALWVSSSIVGSINSLPLVPKLMELIGLGYSGWFVYRYMLYKDSREELGEEIESLKAKISGEE